MLQKFRLELFWSDPTTRTQQLPKRNCFPHMHELLLFCPLPNTKTFSHFPFPWTEILQKRKQNPPKFAFRLVPWPADAEQPWRRIEYGAFWWIPSCLCCAHFRVANRSGNRALQLHDNNSSEDQNWIWRFLQQKQKKTGNFNFFVFYKNTQMKLLFYCQREGMLELPM